MVPKINSSSNKNIKYVSEELSNQQYFYTVCTCGSRPRHIHGETLSLGKQSDQQDNYFVCELLNVHLSCLKRHHSYIVQHSEQTQTNIAFQLNVWILKQNNRKYYNHNSSQDEKRELELSQVRICFEIHVKPLLGEEACSRHFIWFGPSWKIFLLLIKCVHSHH